MTCNELVLLTLSLVSIHLKLISNYVLFHFWFTFNEVIVYTWVHMGSQGPHMGAHGPHVRWNFFFFFF
jgi:hypothetical protein